MKKIMGWSLGIIAIGIILWLLFTPSQNVSLEQKALDEMKSLLTGTKVGIYPGDLAPNIELVDIETYDVSLLSEIEDKIILLNFWASWCPPCREEMPDIERIHQEEADVEVVSLNVTGTEKSDRAPIEFAMEHDLTFPIYQDVEELASTLYQINPLPTTYIINKEGMITSVHTHFLTHEQMLDAIEFARFTTSDEFKK